MTWNAGSEWWGISIYSTNCTHAYVLDIYILLISKQAVDLANTTISNSKTSRFKTEHQPTSTTHQLSWWAHLPDVIEQEKDV